MLAVFLTRRIHVATAARTLDQAPATPAPARIPWYLTCAVLAVTSVTIGAHWDVSWHRSIGRDTFWTPAHMAIYLCGVLAGICCGSLIFGSTFAPAAGPPSVRVFGFRGPLGAFVAAWGGVAMLTSAPFDNWWHNAYGLDVKIISPPHTLLMLGIFAVEIGTLLLILAAMNRTSDADAALRTRLQWIMLYVFGLMMVLTMFFRMEYTWDILLHSARPYVSIAMGVPLYFAALWKASRHPWACTLVCAFYSLTLIAFILVLPLFPASPRLGPVYTPVTQFIPPKFPILLIVPAVAIDLFWRRFGERSKLLVSLASGPLFVLTLVAAEWPFAGFLMSQASANRFFGTGYHDYGTPAWSADVQRRFVDVQHGAALWTGLGMAMLYAAVSVWLGLLLGDWMRRVRR
jgi:hypothetical protein